MCTLLVYEVRLLRPARAHTRIKTHTYRHVVCAGVGAEELPARFQGRAAEWGVRRSTADYLAGMTDRFLEQDHGRRLC